MRNPKPKQERGKLTPAMVLTVGNEQSQPKKIRKCLSALPLMAAEVSETLSFRW